MLCKVISATEPDFDHFRGEGAGLSSIQTLRTFLTSIWVGCRKSKNRILKNRIIVQQGALKEGILFRGLEGAQPEK